MKISVKNFLLLISLYFLLCSCNDDKENQKYVEKFLPVKIVSTINEKDPETVYLQTETKFLYDEFNRITTLDVRGWNSDVPGRATTFTRLTEFEYTDNGLTRHTTERFEGGFNREYTFSYNVEADVLHTPGSDYIIDGKGRLVQQIDPQESGYYYEYDEYGNLKSAYTPNYAFNYKYDVNPGIFRFVTTPMWFLTLYSEGFNTFQNNVTEIEQGENKYYFEYIYNEHGYPENVVIPTFRRTYKEHVAITYKRIE